jgi:hypothetical protein
MRRSLVTRPFRANAPPCAPCQRTHGFRRPFEAISWSSSSTPQLTSAILLTFRVSTRSAQPQPSEKQSAVADALSAVMEFILDLAALAKDAANGLGTVLLLTFWPNMRFTAKSPSSVAGRTGRRER